MGLSHQLSRSDPLDVPWASKLKHKKFKVEAGNGKGGNDKCTDNWKENVEQRRVSSWQPQQRHVWMALLPAGQCECL
jgi:hypothetical protein